MGATPRAASRPRTTPPHKVAARKKALHTIPTRVPGKVYTGAHRPTTHGYSDEELIATPKQYFRKTEVGMCPRFTWLVSPQRLRSPLDSRGSHVTRIL